MNWLSENTGPSESDMERVYRYGSQETLVLRQLTSDLAPVVWSHKTPEDWRAWFEDGVPLLEKDSGLVAILARRSSEPHGLMQRIMTGATKFASPKLEKSQTEPLVLNEKDRSYSWPLGEKILASPDHASSQRPSNTAKGLERELRGLPFDKETFRGICHHLYIHSSISRVISRADVPFFSRDIVKMGAQGSEQQAIVYNCRSANTWKDDLALTITHFPKGGLTFAILFGCTLATEEQVLNRIATAKEHVFHPLLLAGIFAELERTRMAEVVERTVDDIEEAIFELNSGTASKEVAGELSDEDDGEDFKGIRHVRRTVWLNTTFLRSRLNTWRTQLHKMTEHIDELLGSYKGLFGTEPDEYPWGNSQMDTTSRLIKDRLQVLMEELGGMIEECSMRVDSMTITTQWASGDTNTDIAAAAGRDNSQMLSISLVTMIFLPGTFFATLFSMTFFNWSPGSGDDHPTVSSYLWIYFVLTGFFTIFTLAAWWYFLVYRANKARYAKAKRWLGWIGMA